MYVISSSRMAIDDIEVSARREILDKYGSYEAYCTEELISEREHMIEMFRKIDILEPCEVICVSCKLDAQAGPKIYKRYPSIEAVLEELCHGVYTLGYSTSRVMNLPNKILMLYTNDMLYYFICINIFAESVKYSDLEEYKYCPEYLEAISEDREIAQKIKYDHTCKKYGHEKEVKYCVKRPFLHNRGWSKYGKGTQRRPRKKPFEPVYYPFNPKGSKSKGEGCRVDVQGIQEGVEGRDD